MLRLFPALALVLSLGLAGSGTVSAAPLITVETAPGDDAAIIDGVKRTHAPDPRTKLFEVTAETSGGITVLKGPHGLRRSALRPARRLLRSEAPRRRAR